MRKLVLGGILLIEQNDNTRFQQARERQVLIVTGNEKEAAELIRVSAAMPNKIPHHSFH